MKITKTFGDRGRDREIELILKRLDDLEKETVSSTSSTKKTPVLHIGGEFEIGTLDETTTPPFPAIKVLFDEDYFTVTEQGETAQLGFIPSALSVDIGDPVGGSTAGSVLWIDSNEELAEDNANFFWDETNKSLRVKVADSTVKKAFEATETTTDQTSAQALIRTERISTGAISSAFGSGLVVHLGQSSGSSVQIAAFLGQYGGSGTTEGKAVIVTRSGNTIMDHSHFNSDGALSMQIVGGGINWKEGSNARAGTATLVGGTVTVSTTKVTANSRIVYARQATGGTLGHLSIGTITAGTSFVINSSSGTDTSVIYWQIVEPA